MSLSSAHRLLPYADAQQQLGPTGTDWPAIYTSSCSHQDIIRSHIHSHTSPHISTHCHPSFTIHSIPYIPLYQPPFLRHQSFHIPTNPTRPPLPSRPPAIHQGPWLSPPLPCPPVWSRALGSPPGCWEHWSWSWPNYFANIPANSLRICFLMLRHVNQILNFTVQEVEAEESFSSLLTWQPQGKKKIEKQRPAINTSNFYPLPYPPLNNNF